MANKKETVLHLLNSSSFSGAENVVCQIIEDTRDEHDVYYCSPDGLIRDVLKERDIQYIPIEKLSYFSLKKIIDQYQPSVVHAHDFNASLIASLFTHCSKVISQIHQNPKWLNSVNVRSVLYGFALRKFHKVIVVTDAIKKSKTFQNFAKNNDSKILTVVNRLDVDRIKKKANETDVDSYDICYCGRLEAVKNPKWFISVIAEIKKQKPDVRAVVVGDGSLFEECEEYIDSLGLKSNVDLIGFKKNPFPFMKNSKFLFLTSEEEGFGLVAIEAAALGALVISRELESVRELLPNAGVFVNTTDEMAAAYLKYSTESSAYSKKINNTAKDIARYANRDTHIFNAAYIDYKELSRD